jgi:hypothetical protein
MSVSKQDTDLQGSKLRRSTRESQLVSKLKPNMSGKWYAQDNKKKRKVAFAEDKLRQLEYCHNLVSQVKPQTRKKMVKYGSNQAMQIARFIQDTMMNAKEHEASFVQHYILQKGLSSDEDHRSAHHNMLVDINPELYGPAVVLENCMKVFYVKY